MKKISKYLKVLLINFILFAYLTELLLFLLLPDTQKKLLKIQETRATIAKKLNRNYDLRSKELAFSQIKKNNPNLVPSFYFNKGFANLETFKKAILLDNTFTSSVSYKIQSSYSDTIDSENKSTDNLIPY